MAIYLHEISHPYWRTESIIRGVAFCFPNENATVGTKMRLHLYCAMIMRDIWHGLRDHIHVVTVALCSRPSSTSAFSRCRF